MTRIGRLTWAFTLLAVSMVGIACAVQAPATPEARRRALAEKLGRGAAEEIQTELAGHEQDPALGYFLGEAFAVRGQLARAESVFAFLGRSPSPDRFVARARLAELALAQGKQDEAERLADGLATELEKTPTQPASSWLALGMAYQTLGRRHPAQFKDALAAYDRAIAADSGLLEANLREGQLFLAKYVAPEAKKSYAQVLRRDPGNVRAELGLAEIALFDGDPGSFALVRKALQSGPGLARGHTLLARLELDAESWDSARVHADRALALDSTDLDAWAIRGSIHYLTGDTAGFRAIEARVKERHRAPTAFYVGLGEALGRQRRYRQAATMGAAAVALDRDDPDGLTVWGTNLLRLGQIDSGRAVLERAFGRDPYHVWNKNTLDLLDELAKYPSVARGRFVFVAPPDEVELLSLYLAPLLERAFDSLAARYRYQPPTPVRLELYRRHADFSVRTVGLAGLGALGVSFGSTLAMDAPSARPPGDFNWGSTAWHELTHAFTLGTTDHKVPRWVSEGLSVVEERRARAGWGAQATTAFLGAYKGGKVPPVSRMNDGFIRPEYPAQVMFSYYQASLIMDWIEATKGFGAILDLLQAYRQGAENDAALVQVLGMPAPRIDQTFDVWIKERFAEPLKHVAALRDSTAEASELTAVMRAARERERSADPTRAIETYELADRMFPNSADRDSPAWSLAKLYLVKGDTARSLDYLGRVTALQESNYEANRLEGMLAARRRDNARATAALERAVYISPQDAALHVELAEAAKAAGNSAVALRERRAVVALRPTDRAEALYQLAVAFKDAGDVESARREVLRALEDAPSFEKAQQLLLELRKPGNPSR